MVAVVGCTVVDARWHKPKYSSFCGYNLINSDEMIFANFRDGFTFELRTADNQPEKNIHLACRSDFQRDLSCKLTNNLDKCSIGFDPTILLMYTYINGELIEVTPITIINIIDRFNIFHVKHNAEETLTISDNSKDVVENKMFEIVTAYSEPLSPYQYPYEVFIQMRNSMNSKGMYKCLLIEQYNNTANHYRIVYNKDDKDCMNIDLFAVKNPYLNFQIVVRYTAFPYVTDIVHTKLKPVR